MYSNSQTNSIDFGQSGGLNKTRKVPFGFGQFETEDDFTGGMGLYSRVMEKEQLQYYNQQHNPLPDPNYFGSGANNAIGNSTMLPMMNSGGSTGSAVSRASLTGQLSRPPQQQTQPQGLTIPHSSFSMQQQISPASAVIGSPSHGAGGMLMGGQSGHGMGPDVGGRSSAPGMMSMNMGLPVNKPNMRLGGVGISQPANFPGGLSSIDSTSQNLDLSEFPTLRSMGMNIRRDIPQGPLPSNANLQFPPNPNSQVGFHNPHHQITAGPVTQVPEQAAEFQMHHEDFPALPGLNSDPTQEQHNSLLSQSSVVTPGGVSYQNKVNANLNAPSTNFSAVASAQLNSHSDSRPTQHYDLAPGSGKERTIGVPAPIGPPSKSQNRDRTQEGVGTLSIPDGMVRNQFGMFGLLTFIRAAETDSKLVSLALGSDLTTLGLNLNSPESLFASFSSPWSDTPARPQDIDYNVPQEYIINMKIRDKLAPIKLNKYGDELLFYLYYNNGNDVLQMYANIELHSRNWRYHKEERVWILKVQGIDPVYRTQTHEQGTFIVFDVKQFKKIHKDMTVEFCKLEDRPFPNMNSPHLTNNTILPMHTYTKSDLN